MKFMTLVITPVEKVAEVAAASDKIMAKVPKERRAESGYILMCVPFDVPPNSMVSVTIAEGGSAEEMAASVYPLMLAGATVDVIPLLEVPSGGSTKAEKKFKG